MKEKIIHLKILDIHANLCKHITVVFRCFISQMAESEIGISSQVAPEERMFACLCGCQAPLRIERHQLGGQIAGGRGCVRRELGGPRRRIGARKDDLLVVGQIVQAGPVRGRAQHLDDAGDLLNVGASLCARLGD